MLVFCALAVACDGGEQTVVGSPTPTETVSPVTTMPTTTLTTEPTATATPATEDMTDAIEALYRHQFEHNASGLQQTADVYFLNLQGDDPPAEIMKRFAGHDPPVRPLSRVEAGSGVQGVLDSVTGERGLIFNISEISASGEDAIEATGGYYEAGLSASTNEYRLEREDAGWTVVEDRIIIIS